MLMDKTNDVKIMMQRLKKHYLETNAPNDIKDIAFFNHVKSETEPMFQLTHEWAELAEEQVKTQQLKVHPSQIQSTKENIELVILHSYYHDADHNRYFELHQSIDYVLDMIDN